MQIQSIKGTNFKSFGPEGVSFSFKDGMNTIVGENNVGKSNLIRMIDIVKYSFSENQKKVTDDDFHKGFTNSVMTIELQATLDNNDIRRLMNEFNISLKDDFLHIFGEQLTIEVHSSKSSEKWEPSLLHIGQMRIYSNFQGSIFEWISSGINKPDAQWKPDFIDRSYQLHRPLSEVFDEYASQPSSRDVKFDFGINVYDAIKNLFNDRIRSFAEFREITRDGIQQSSDSIQADLSSHLIKLRNGTLKQRQRFAKIQSHFSEMFLNWDLEVRNLIDRNQPQIVIVKNKEYEASQEGIGAGILETINLITYLIDTEGAVFLIDEPELHLHPHAERLMSKLIKECSNNNQVICITHSPIFIDTDDIEKITIVHETAGKTNLIIFDTCRVQNYSQIKEKLLSKLTSNEKEFFFSRCVLLVEGPTEYGAMPILARKLGSDLDNFGVSVIAVGGNNFGRFVELLTGFRIPCMVMCDKDTLTNIYKTIKIDGQEIKTSILIKQLDDFNRLSPDDKNIIKENSSNEIQQTKQKSVCKILNQSIAYKNNYIVLSSDFEGVFKKASHTDVFEEANEEYGDNKVLQGRFVAYKIDKDDIPVEIAKVIEQTIDLCSDKL